MSFIIISSLADRSLNSCQSDSSDMDIIPKKRSRKNVPKVVQILKFIPLERAFKSAKIKNNPNSKAPNIIPLRDNDNQIEPLNININKKINKWGPLVFNFLSDCLHKTNKAAQISKVPKLKMQLPDFYMQKYPKGLHWQHRLTTITFLYLKASAR